MSLHLCLAVSAWVIASSMGPTVKISFVSTLSILIVVVAVVVLISSTVVVSAPLVVCVGSIIEGLSVVILAVVRLPIPLILRLYVWRRLLLLLCHLLLHLAYHVVHVIEFLLHGRVFFNQVGCFLAVFIND